MNCTSVSNCGEHLNGQRTYPNYHRPVVFCVDQQLQRIVPALAAAYPCVDRAAHDLVYLVGGPEFLDHARRGEPREQDSCGGGAAVENVVQVFQTRNKCHIIGNVVTGNRAYSGLE